MIVKGDARLEMMGGEFSGNGLRCLAYLYCLMNGTKGVLLESSGFIGSIVTYADKNTARMTLPLKSIGIEVNKVDMAGITFIIKRDTVNTLKNKRI